MEINKIISRIKGVFWKVEPDDDARCKIQPGTLITALICGLSTQDGRSKTISGLRKSVIEFTKQSLSRSAFWDRMASNRLMNNLYILLNTLISPVSSWKCDKMTMCMK